MSARERINATPASGKVPWPLILLEGDEGAGKTWAALALAASERIGWTYAIDLGEGSADEYGPLAHPDRPIQVVRPKGQAWQFTELVEQVAAIRDFAFEERLAGHPPTLLVIDTMADEYELLKTAMNDKAKRSKANQARLREDPLAEVQLPHHAWNTINAKHNRLMALLMTFPGIVVMTSRGKWTTPWKDGAPVEGGAKEWKVEGHKHLTSKASAVVRLTNGSPALLVKCRSYHYGVRPNADEDKALPEDWTLDRLIFDVMKVDPDTSTIRTLADLRDDEIDLPDGIEHMGADQFLRERVVPAWNDVEALRRAWSEVQVRGIADVLVAGPPGTPDAPIHDLIGRRIQALSAPQAAPQAAEQPQEPQNGHQEPQEAAPAPQQAPEQAPEPQEAPQTAQQRLLADLYAQAQAATELEAVRVVWRLSGDVRALEVDHPHMGRVPFGRYLMERQAQLAGPPPMEGVTAGGERTLDPRERAAGESAD